MSQSRNFSFTWNNYPDDHIALLDMISCKYLIYGREVAPTTGTKHLQGAIIFPSARRLPSVVKQLPGCHIEIARDIHQLIEYCKKEGDFIEKGTPPSTPRDKGLKEQARWDQARKAAQAGDFDAVPSDIYIRCRHAIHAIAVANLRPPPDSDSTTGLWIHGPPGSGKSRLARELYPGIYDKPCNKWFDGYTEGPILLDDFDLTHKALGHHLKRWADRYAFTAEIKGGTISIRPSKVVVTSNYSIQEIFGEDAVLAEAISRRFETRYLDLSFVFPNTK